jgi:tRNA pseudouridine55 synthase
MNGILCVNKPEGWTSFDVVAKVRGIAHTRKVGHAGTLDPMATGVLPLFLGIATKACDVMPGEDKAYRATFRLGMTTTTQDRTGEVLTQTASAVTEEQLRAALLSFCGEIEQIPPMYSAVQVNGRRLYDLARAGREVERKPRKVTIYALSLLSFDEEHQTGVLDVRCSKGTYIRTLCHDLGATLGVGATLTALERYEAGNFSLSDCYTIEELQQFEEQGILEEKVLPVEQVFLQLPKIRLNAVQSVKFQNGVKLDLNRVRYKKVDGLHRVFDADNHFLGLATLNLQTMELVIAKMFYR